MPQGFNGTQQIIDIPANTGAFLAILATGPVRRVSIVESVTTSAGSANVPQGLNYKLPNDGTPNGFQTVFATVPPTAAQTDAKPATICLGDHPGDMGPHGSILGNGSSWLIGIGQTPATTLLTIRSATGTATSIQIRQDY